MNQVVVAPYMRRNCEDVASLIDSKRPHAAARIPPDPPTGGNRREVAPLLWSVGKGLTGNKVVSYLALCLGAAMSIANAGERIVTSLPGTYRI